MDVVLIWGQDLMLAMSRGVHRLLRSADIYHQDAGPNPCTANSFGEERIQIASLQIPIASFEHPAC